MRKTIIAAVCLILGASLQAKKAETKLNIIPEPRSVSVNKGSFKITVGSAARFITVSKPSQSRRIAKIGSFPVETKSLMKITLDADTPVINFTDCRKRFILCEQKLFFCVFVFRYFCHVK